MGIGKIVVHLDATLIDIKSFDSHSYIATFFTDLNQSEELGKLLGLSEMELKMSLISSDKKSAQEMTCCYDEVKKLDIMNKVWGAYWTLKIPLIDSKQSLQGQRLGRLMMYIEKPLTMKIEVYGEEK